MTARSLLTRLDERCRARSPIRVGLIGAGVFGTMFLRQAARIEGIDVVAVCDLDRTRAASAVDGAGLVGRVSIDEDGLALASGGSVDVVVEATGDPVASTRHALAALHGGTHVVNVTVEADALIGPVFARAAEASGVVYSMAYGDQPALICELVDWARLNGFSVVCAGKGTLHQDSFLGCTPETVWEHYGFTVDQVRDGGYGARMFTSFVDGTKSAIEMAAVANATGLVPQADGLRFPAAGVDDLADVCRPEADGGQLDRAGTVEVVSSLHPDGSAVERDLRFGVFVVIEAADEVTRRQFRDYGLSTDVTGRYAAIWRPNHLIGMELASSVAAVALRHEATGVPGAHVADAVAVAKRDLPAGTPIDGEGGYMVRGHLLSAGQSCEAGALPIALSRGARTTREISRGEMLTWGDVVLAPELEDVADLRRLMETSPGRQISGGSPLLPPLRDTRIQMPVGKEEV